MKIIFPLLFFVFALFPAVAEVPEKPSNFVTDQANILSEDLENMLNAELKAWQTSSGNQLFVLTDSSLNGQDIVSLSQDIFHRWEIGGKEKNNGILLCFFKAENKIRIHVGYGLEAVLPDISCKKILTEVTRPYRNKGMYDSAIVMGARAIMLHVQPAGTEQGTVDSVGDQSADDAAAFGITFFIFVVVNFALTIFWLFKMGKVTGCLDTGFRTFIVGCCILGFVGTFILVLIFLIWLGAKRGWSSSSSSSSSYDSSGSDWSSGGFDSDGFDGGGGGDSGGGGASD